MKKLIALLLFAAAVLEAADPVYVTVNSTPHPAKLFANSKSATVTAEMVFGGTGAEPVPAWAGKVVLTDRGGISFAEKAKRAATVGAVGLIIANNVAGPANDGTLAPDTAAFPVVSVSQASGAILKTLAGDVARIGSVAPPAPIPDPTGRKGEFLRSDGQKYVLSRPPPIEAVADIELELGGRLVLSVTANGTAPFSFQWFRDGQPIPYAQSPVYHRTNITIEDAGSYVCQVSNESGTAPSAPVAVKIK